MLDLTAAEKLLIELFDIGAVRFDGPFKFKIHKRYPDFPMSPNKIDLRTPENGGNLTPELILGIGWELYKKAMRSQILFDLVVGLPKAGEPFAEVVAQYSHKSLLKFSKQTKAGDGRCIGRIISGKYQSGQRVLVLDDVISQGFSKIEGIAELEKTGLLAAAILVFVDREEGGSEYLQELGYRVVWVYEFSRLLHFYFRAGRINQQELDESLAYSKLAKQLFFSQDFS